MHKLKKRLFHFSNADKLDAEPEIINISDIKKWPTFQSLDSLMGNFEMEVANIAPERVLPLVGYKIKKKKSKLLRKNQGVSKITSQFPALYNAAQQGQLEKPRVSLDNNVNRFNAQLDQLDQLMEEVRQYRPGNEILESHGPLRKIQKRKTTIKQLFSAASKFQRNLHREEWGYLKQLNRPEVVNNTTEVQRNFLDLVTSASKRLFNYMDVNSDDIISHRIFESNIIELNDEVSFIVICPSAELSCAVPGQRELLLQRGDLLSLPIKVFEMIHLNTYKPNITKKYAKLSCSLELDIASADHLHREAFSNTEIASAKAKLLKLQELQDKMNNIWNSVRWLMNVITFARDRVSLGISIRCLMQTETTDFGTPGLLQIPPEEKLLKHTLGRGSWPGPGHAMSSTNLITEFSKSEQNLNINEYTNNYSNNSIKEPVRKDSITPAKSENMLCRLATPSQQRERANTICNMSSNIEVPLLSVKQSNSLASINTINVTDTSNSIQSVSSDSDCSLQPFMGSFNKRRKSKMVTSKSMINVKQSLKIEKVKSPNRTLLHPDLNSSLSKSLTNFNAYVDVEDGTKDTGLCQSDSKNENGILQVYAAYETGLASGTSLKLHVTPQTTAREVVDLVVKQLNMAVILKGKDGPVYDVDKLNNFCLVAVIGARERCLRDDFKPLHLQNPWRQGRLYVRQKQDVLAALEHSSKHTLII
ncbi:unnamed protein product [Diabrotica balteata]|uniref:Ras-associating domain-containing protein n=1 Tax=Diabrotica balteata TaxID=107213 RepID=A0A9N9SS11_DIABA|nr:unnamed protein product [Diabrotica balteata]